MEVITHAIAFLAGLGTAYTVKLVTTVRTNRKSNTRIVKQTRNTAGGDIVAGNSTKAEK